MNTTTNIAQNSTIFLSEIATLSHSEINLLRFRLSPHINERELGNPLSFHLCRKFAEIIVVWEQGDFFAIAKLQQQQNMPTVAQWREAIDSIQNEMKELGDRPFSVQVVNSDEITPEVLAKLAYQILKISRPFSNPPFKKQSVQVVRKPNFWSETVEINGLIRPALALGVSSDIRPLAELKINPEQRKF